MPSSLQARMIRRAISPRLAMRMRLYMRPLRLLDLEERLVELNGFAIFHKDGGDSAADLSRDFVEDLHGLDDADRGVHIHFAADFDERFRLGVWLGIIRADHGALDGHRVRTVRGGSTLRGRSSLGRGISWRRWRRWGISTRSFPRAAADADAVARFAEVDLRQVV